MKEIPLTRGFRALIDDEDFELVSRHSWHVMPSHGGRQMYAASGGPLVNGRRATIRMHRLIMNAKPEVSVDHISCDGLDNRRSNLRPATPVQNGQNRRTNSNNRCGFKGVRMRRGGSTFQVRIVVDGKRRNIGNFATAEEAARAYDDAAREHFGDFARLNFGETA